jgi:hypothetical protein
MTESFRAGNHLARFFPSKLQSEQTGIFFANLEDIQ